MIAGVSDELQPQQRPVVRSGGVLIGRRSEREGTRWDWLRFFGASSAVEAAIFPA